MAVERTVRVRLSAEVGDYIAKMTAAGAKTAELATRVEQVAARNKRTWATVSTGLLGVGAAATLAAGKAVSGWATFDQQMSAVKATGSDAATNLDALTTAALDAGRSFGQFTATDAAKGLEELAKAGMSASDSLDGGLNGSLSLAAAGTLDVGRAAEITATSLAQFQLDGRDAAKVADLLAAGAGKAVGEVSDIADALKMGGTVANQFGLSIEETVGTLSLFSQNALTGSDAGTSLKAMLLQLASPSKEAAETLDELGISAYDAQGQFVGMVDLADQLQSQLAGLSQEQQNAALKTIFGADAIRSASILMREGGDAVTQWTKDVSEQGYAADVAATKMDNLRGDLAALSGSWETFTTKMGAAGDGPLRKAVQDVTGLIDKLGEMSPAAQETLFAGTVAVGGFALLAGGTMKAITAAAALKTSLATLNVQMLATGAGAGGLGGKLAAAGAALGKFAVLYGAVYAVGAGVDAKFGRDATEADKLTASLEGLADGSAAARKSLDSMMSDSIASKNPWKKEVTDLSSAFVALKKNTNWMNEGFTGLGQIVGLDTQLADIREQFAGIDQALTGMDGAKAAQAFSYVADKAAAAGVSVEQVRDLMPEYAAQVEAAAARQGAYNLSAQELVDWMGGKVPDAIVAAQKANDEFAASNKALYAAMAAGTAGTKENTAALEANAKKVRDNANNRLAASGSLIGMEAAIDQATASLKDNGKTLDINTEKGRANRSALDQIAAAGLAAAEGLTEAGASTEKVTQTQERAYDKFVDAAVAMGMTRDKAKELAKQYGLIPTKVDTKITSKADLAAAEEAKRVLDSIKDKTVTIRTIHTNQGGATAATYQAAGGYIHGPGTGTSDSIPAWLSNGEYVLRAAAVDALGLARLDYMNRHGRIPAFASGGLATQAPSAHAAYPGALSATVDTSGMAQAVRDGLASSRLSLTIPGIAGAIDARILAVQQASDMSVRTGGTR